jgi:hypothetical protein
MIGFKFQLGGDSWLLRMDLRIPVFEMTFFEKEPQRDCFAVS